MSHINQQMLPMGTVLDNRYRIIRYLASGGFGNTYVAEDTRLGGQVAVKEFFMRGTNHRSADGTTVEVSNDTNTPVFKTQLEKFKREARRIFELRNDHIIHVSDLFDANNTSYYIMDFVKGTSLANQTLPEDDALDVILQVLDALDTMHKAGLYHLDVKPGNIMRDTNGHCTLIDFGASKQLSADERNTLSSSTMAYTPGYAPLEQTAQQSKDIGPWTDFYALGATLYRMVTGNTPPEVSVTDSAPDGRQFPYPKTVSTTLRHIISTLMNPIYTLRAQTTDEVRALLDGTNKTKEGTKLKEIPKPEEETKLEEDPKPKVEDNRMAGHTEEKTRLSSTTTPSKGLWYGLAALASLALLLLFVNYGGCDTKTLPLAETDSMKVVSKPDEIAALEEVATKEITKSKPDENATPEEATTKEITKSKPEPNEITAPASMVTINDGKKYYTVKKGDTWSMIAKKLYHGIISTEEIAKWNNRTTKEPLEIGESLFVK